MRNAEKKIWVAVRIQRGLVSDVRAFSYESAARQREALWRRKMNPDYDETAILPVYVTTSIPQRARKNSKKAARVSSHP